MKNIIMIVMLILFVMSFISADDVNKVTIPVNTTINGVLMTGFDVSIAGDAEALVFIKLLKSDLLKADFNETFMMGIARGHGNGVIIEISNISYFDNKGNPISQPCEGYIMYNSSKVLKGEIIKIAEDKLQTTYMKNMTSFYNIILGKDYDVLTNDMKVISMSNKTKSESESDFMVKRKSEYLSLLKSIQPHMIIKNGLNVQAVFTKEFDYFRTK